MLFNVIQSKLQQGIQFVQKAVSVRNTMPILTGIYLEAVKDKGLHLIANDLEIGIEYWVEADIINEGALVLPASQFTNIIRELPDAEIKAEGDLEHFQLKINCLNSEFTLKGYQADEFPQLPAIKTVYNLNFTAADFKDMIDEVKFSTSTDQTQPALTGGLLYIDAEGINLVTTNTYRLAYRKFPRENIIEENISVILPGKTLNELSHLIQEEGEIEIFISENYVLFKFNGITLISRLIEGGFPNYRQVIPDQCNSEIKVDRNELLRAVKRVSLIASLDSNVISIMVKEDQIQINSGESDYGNAHESLEIELKGSEQKIDIDASYLIDVLRVLSQDIIRIELIGPLYPMTVKKEDSDDYIYLIMPIRPGA